MTRQQKANPRGTRPSFLFDAEAIEVLVLGLTVALLTLAFVLGGSGRDRPFAIMAIELVGVLLLAASIWRGALAERRQLPTPLLSLLILLVAVPLLQVLPLPPAIWTMLPGREAAVETLAVAGLTPGWAPLSLDPAKTFDAVLWLMAPAAIFLAVSSMSQRRRLLLVGLVLGLVLVGLAYGGFQVSALTGVATAEGTLPVGFFSNRNHQGIAMAVAIPFVAAAASVIGADPLKRQFANIAYAILTAVFVVGALVTQSRAGFVLAAGAVIISVAIFWAAYERRERSLQGAITIGSLTALLAIALPLGIFAVLDRFRPVDEVEGRFAMWPAIIEAGAHLNPAGSGIGTFDSIYRAGEPLRLFGENYVNHAHNDYLELWMETGLLFPLLFMVFAALVVKASWEAWARSDDRYAPVTRAAGAVVVLLLLHSVVDYPLRVQALACIFALAAALLLTPARPSAELSTVARRPSRSRAT